MADSRACRVSGSLRKLGAATALGFLAAVGAVALSPAQSHAQGLLQTSGNPDAQMLLESDELIFDHDRDTVTAAGSVRIDYDGSRLVAQRVVYNRATGRLMAIGEVEILDRDGNRIFTDQIDVTDDFRDGFVNALRVETADETYFGAESARRESGTVTTFNNGVYTACKPCENKPGRPPIWRVKGQTIIWNSEKKTIRFHHARLELFGLPLAYLPFLEVPDHTVKRKTGFLAPGIVYKSELGFGVSVPFYFALSPTFDLTVQGTYLSKQGFLGEAEWRQKFDSGQYNLRVAGIRQNSPEAFTGQVDRGVNFNNKTRFMIATKGDFTINPRWTFGWDLMAQSDKRFAHSYGINGYSGLVNKSEIYLTGLNQRNYFDLRAMRFQVQELFFNEHRSASNPRQPWVLPTLDYTFTPEEPVAGGELRIDVNSRVLRRERLDNPGFDSLTGEVFNPQADISGVIRGYEGTSGRITTEAVWKRSFIAPGGLVLTPILHAQGDATFTDITALSAQRANVLAQQLGVASDIRASYYRYMATAGLEARWPVLFSSTSATHILEPVAQVFVRPDEPYAGTIGVPNEDAQSMVFDAASLFERDKFTGYDRIEGGIRANVGFRYSASFANGWSANAIFGQSYHLGGVNSFAAPDLVNVGAFSGLDSDRSDYVGMVGITSPGGLSVAAGGRFDKDTFEVRRAEAQAGLVVPSSYSIRARYAYIQAQPLYGFPDDRHEVALSGSLNFNENWRAFGSLTYDLERRMVTSDAIGFSYMDECVIYSMTLSERRSITTREVTRTIGFNLTLRTLGEFGTSRAGF